MPISAVSPEMRIHSWSFVYFKSDGYMCAPEKKEPGCIFLREPPENSTRFPFVERQRHHARLAGAAADVDLDFGARGRQRNRYVGHPDGLLQERRLRAAGDDADRPARVDHRIAVPGDPAVDHLEPDDLARDAALLLLAQALMTGERRLLPSHRPAQVRLEDARGLVDVVAVQPHARLEPQRIAR